jgi:hypothetical protein
MVFLILIEIQKSDQKNKVARMVVYIVVAPLYQFFSWWTTALVSSLINVALGFGLPECQADIVKGQFENASAKSVDAAVGVATLTDMHQQWRADRTRMCTGKLATTKTQTYSVRYKIEDRGNSLFRNSLHGLYLTMHVE